MIDVHTRPGEQKEHRWRVRLRFWPHCLLITCSGFALHQRLGKDVLSVATGGVGGRLMQPILDMVLRNQNVL